ncbi:MAG: AraC family transcriptional regulator, partial [Anaerovorax sp.]
MLETIIYEENLHVKVEILSIKDYPLHIHEDIQILCVLEGEIDLQLCFGIYRLKKNQIHFIHSEDVHGIQQVSEHNLLLILSIDTLYYMQFYPNLQTQLFSTKIDEGRLLYHRQQLELKFYLFSILSELIACKGDYKNKISIISKQLINTLYQYFRSFNIDTASNTFEHNFSQDLLQLDRVSRIVALIYNNYNEKLVFTEIAEKEHINRFYLSHIFQRFTGLNFREFISMVRVERSEVILLDTDYSISHIALDSGFSNVSYYIEHFKKWFGIHPSEYRQRYKKKTIKFTNPILIYHELEVVKDILADNLRFISASKEGEDYFIVPKTNIQLYTLPFYKIPLLTHCKISFYNPDLITLNSPQVNHAFLHLLKQASTSQLSLSIVITEGFSHLPTRKNKADTLSALIHSISKNCINEPFHFSLLDIVHKSNGILEKNGLKRPIYYFLEFLLTLDEDLYVCERYIVSRKKGIYKLLFWNLDSSLEKEVILDF